MPPRPLHHQLMIDRDICITEQMDMHLVWTTGQIFLKPIPRFLLDPGFWRAHLPKNSRFQKCALGFLFSYAALISYESDLFIAQDRHLIPKEVEWQDWKTFVKEILQPGTADIDGPQESSKDPQTADIKGFQKSSSELKTAGIYDRIDDRFIYGELRLSRLNKIYRLKQGAIARGYMAQWHQYGTFLQDNLVWVASAIIYITIVLTAMQVGLATKLLGDNDAFQSASYGFTVFSILGPLIVLTLLFFTFCLIFVSNWVVAVNYKQERLRSVGKLSPPNQRGPTKQLVSPA